jgi:nitrite reductase/ring-hydroxylating ferredoxin subunit
MSTRGSKILMAIAKSGFLLCMLAASSCKPDLSDDPIPIVFFPAATLNLNLPDYSALKVDGGFKSVGSVAGSSVGVRGIILYRQSATNYYAYEANCSYHPNEAGSTVSIHASGLYMMCAGCGSNFSFTDGAPTGGIAWRPLRKYRTELDGFNLTITNDVLN